MPDFLRPALVFIVLCLIARLCYSLNDVLVGRLARAQDPVELGAFRGVSLGLTMAPWLLLVPSTAWTQLATRWQTVLWVTGATAIANILQFRAARYLPFGLRAALMISTMALCSVLLGWGLLGEQLTTLQIVLCTVLVGSGVAVALGSYSIEQIEVDILRGAGLTVMSAVLIALSIFGLKQLAEGTHPLLAAWAWEFGAGLLLVGPALLGRPFRTSTPRELLARFRKIAVAASPTALASGTSVLALGFGELGLWGALGGTQILFTASLGAMWHQEKLGVRRWLCMSVSVLAVGGLALFSEFGTA